MSADDNRFPALPHSPALSTDPYGAANIRASEQVEGLSACVITRFLQGHGFSFSRAVKSMAGFSR